MLWNIRTGDRTPVPTDGPLTDVNAHGWAVMSEGRLFRDGAIVALPVESGETAYPQGVSDGGLIVGSVSTGPRESARVEPATWRC
ncbi:MAG: hypothetical protein HOV79_22065 [Hamadaea sp.]|nr:hypothetical protein [Hamadaea sp.]